MYFYWQLLMILFADDRAKKKKITALSASGKEKYTSGTADLGAAARYLLSFPTSKLLFFTIIIINFPLIDFSLCDDFR